MRNAFVFALVLGIVCAAGQVRAESSAREARCLLTTTGVAEVSAENDAVRLTVGVVTEGTGAETVAERNAAKTKAVLDALQAQRLKDLKLKTARFQVQPQWDYESKPPHITGYQVHDSVSVVWEGADTAQLALWTPRLIQAALANGANAVDELTFYRGDHDRLDQEALAQATAQAMAKAKTMARAAGVTLKRVVALNSEPETASAPPFPVRAMALGVSEKVMAPPVEAGESKVGARVTLVYEIE